MTIAEVFKFNAEYMSVEKYVSLSKEERQKISAVKIIPPDLSTQSGNNDFGKIKVRYKVPVYQVF